MFLKFVCFIIILFLYRSCVNISIKRKLSCLWAITFKYSKLKRNNISTKHILLPTLTNVKSFRIFRSWELSLYIKCKPQTYIIWARQYFQTFYDTCKRLLLQNVSEKNILRYRELQFQNFTVMSWKDKHIESFVFKDIRL